MAKAARKKRSPARKRSSTPRTTRKASTPANAGVSTEEKIMQAAQKLFTQKGFAATRTRDIAKEAGINLALLNYYFRSKEKLFDIVMLNNFRRFLRGISINLADETTPMPEKIRSLTTAYIDFLSSNPDLPLFILNELRANPSGLAEKLHEEMAPARAHLMGQLKEAAREGKMAPIHPFHIIANLVGLTVFPFVGRPLLQRVTGVNDQQFMAFMEERKELVPMWINTIMHLKK